MEPLDQSQAGLCQWASRRDMTSGLTGGPLAGRPRRAISSGGSVRFYVSVQQPSDHSLILRVALRGLALEEIHAALAQSNRDLHVLFTKGKILGRWQEVSNDLRIADRLIAVSDFPVHR